MIHPKIFFEQLRENNTDFFCGVPDSLLKDFCAYLSDYCPSDKHITTANEGAAIGLASGYYLATGKFPLVYMQNSGIGNAVNPLLSLADPEVYSIPMILLIGWRGEPGIKDEPQHVKQGKITLELLEALGIKYAILKENQEELFAQISSCTKYLEINNAPFAFVVKKATFSKYESLQKPENAYSLSREEAINSVMDHLTTHDIVVSTTGMISRELYEYRDNHGEGHHQDFLTVGSMGHASQIALGISLQRKNRRVICLDGDGAVIMHMGSLAIIGAAAPSNYLHVVFNNGAHDSVGGQPTAGFQTDLCAVALACGYQKAFSVESTEDLYKAMKESEEDSPCFLEIKVKKGARPDLGRPKTTPLENKLAFMEFVES